MAAFEAVDRIRSMWLQNSSTPVHMWYVVLQPCFSNPGQPPLSSIEAWCRGHIMPVRNWPWHRCGPWRYMWIVPQLDFACDENSHCVTIHIWHGDAQHEATETNSRKVEILFESGYRSARLLRPHACTCWRLFNKKHRVVWYSEALSNSNKGVECALCSFTCIGCPSLGILGSLSIFS